mmetsp:Transcript_63665/g.151836  ORF Transcript_63665/g.151836 Transcript_63665/m.151836 type:complete len:217 (+) Transcript_63665:190-840(+)|eukprot:CAMPEP_0178381754 /NCGR_PEP_ID=MMETSP0689_2-20121128/6149_1 /TAXON_ID=160604 /ORGANISM="Amphidinium massartii, Strain CS-259" /LENGTH=216 /DNA_ID=CAMNT_0020001953 /DNA_START=112 /DNA_END=762 /DNA_ORIENTATION=+
MGSTQCSTCCNSEDAQALQALALQSAPSLPSHLTHKDAVAEEQVEDFFHDRNLPHKLRFADAEFDSKWSYYQDIDGESKTASTSSDFKGSLGSLGSPKEVAEVEQNEVDGAKGTAPRPLTFQVQLERRPSKPTAGLVIYSCIGQSNVLIRKVVDDGLAMEWNQSSQGHHIEAGDIITSLNGYRHPNAIRRVFEDKDVRFLVLDMQTNAPSAKRMQL